MDTIKRIAILVNPLSGRSRAVHIAGELEQLLTERKIPYQVFVKDWPATFAGFSDVWIIGGDGTLNYFINHYPDIELPLSIFKGGTGNDFSWKLYGKSTTAEQVEQILAAAPKKVDAISCNGKLCINSLGIGFDGEIIHAIRTIRWLGGHTGYLLTVIKNIFSFREKEFVIKLPGKEMQEKFLLININNSTRTGGGFMISPLAAIDDGKVDIVLCGPLPLLKRLRYLPVMQKGKHLQLPFISYFQEAEVEVTAQTNLYGHMDGELMEAKTFSIKVLPARFSFRY